jgi:CTP:molybdopterin cytidylyltransferase MocA
MSGTLPAHGVVVLAAGASTRFGRTKQLLSIDGEALVRRATRLALGTGPADAVVVLGADADAVFAGIGGLAARRIDCADWQQGMSASLRAGVAALAPSCAGVLVVLSDQPALDAAHLEKLLAAWRANAARGIASGYAGHLGVPALLPRAWFAELGSGGDHGARDVIARHRDAVVAIVNESLAWDVDHEHDWPADEK